MASPVVNSVSQVHFTLERRFSSDDMHMINHVTVLSSSDKVGTAKPTLPDVDIHCDRVGFRPNKKMAPAVTTSCIANMA